MISGIINPSLDFKTVTWKERSVLFRVIMSAVNHKIQQMTEGRKDSAVMNEGTIFQTNRAVSTGDLNSSKRHFGGRTLQYTGASWFSRPFRCQMDVIETFLKLLGRFQVAATTVDPARYLSRTGQVYLAYRPI